jgi:membrane protease subunit HflC
MRRNDLMTKQNFIVALIGVVVLLFVLGASPLFVVDLTQSAIVVQLGKPVRSITEPGLQWKVPFIQDVTYFDKRLLDYDSGAQDVITKDKKTLLIDNFAKWRITDPLKVYQAFQTQRSAYKRLDDIIYSELRVEVGRHDLSEIVSKTRSDIMAIVTKRGNEKAAAYGIEIVDVRIKRADLPEQNEKAVFARMQAEREREAKQYRAEGAEEAQKIRSEAEKDREILLAEAYKTAEELRGEGDAKAFKQYADAYRQDPKFFEFTRSMEAYKKTFNGRSTLILTPDSEFFKYLRQR